VASSARPLGRDRRFTIYWLGQALSVFGDALCGIAIPLLVLQATGSLAQMGIVSALGGAGALAAGLFAGPVVDRFDRRRVMIAMDIGRAAVFAAVPLAWWLFGPQIRVLQALAVLGAAMGMIFGVASIAAVANLVDRDQMTEANGRLQATYAVAGTVGPLLAGLLSAQTGPATAIGLNALTFLVSAATLSMIRLRPAPAGAPAPARVSKREELLAGLAFILSQPVFRWMTVLTGGMALVAAGVGDLLVYQLKDVMGQSDQSVGLVWGVASLGAVVSGLLAARLRTRLGVGQMMAAGFVLQAAALLTWSAAPPVAVIAFAAAINTFGQCARGVLTMTLRQELTPDYLLGRVTAAFWTIFTVPGPLGALVLTRLGADLGVPATLGIVGVWTLGLAALTLVSPLGRRAPEQSLTLAPGAP
jgi:Na+/melibiose symporter-like transporter